MDKNKFEKSLTELIPECSKESIQGWFLFAEEMTKAGQDPKFNPVTDMRATIERWFDAIYDELCKVKQEYGIMPVEQICTLAITHALYPWEMMEAGKLFKNGSSKDEVMEMSIDGMLC